MSSPVLTKDEAMREHAQRFLASFFRGEGKHWPEGADEEFTTSLMTACHRHGVAPLLHHRLAAEGQRWGWPSQVKTRLAREEGLGLLRQQVLDRELGKVLESLATRDLRCLVLKGAAVSRLAYPEPHLRPRVDSDLWVRESDLVAVRSCLSGLGYQAALATGGQVIRYQEGFHRTCSAGVSHLLDLHWKISNVQLFSRSLIFEEEWTARAPLSSLSPSAQTLNPVSSLLLACLHRVAHHGSDQRLIWLLDMARLMEMLSPEAQELFVSTAFRKQLGAICHSSLLAAQKASPIAGSETVLQQWLRRPPPGGEKSARFLGYANDRIAIFMSDFWELPGLRLKLKFAVEHLFPPAEYMRKRHPGGSVLRLPWHYLKRAVCGIWRSLFTAGRRVSQKD